MEPHFVPQYKDPNLSPVGSVKYKNSEAYLRTTDVRIAKQFQEKLILSDAGTGKHWLNSDSL